MNGKPRQPDKRRYLPHKPDAWKDESGGLREALRLARVAEKRKPTDDDRPPPSTFRGPKRKPLPGQLTLDDDQTA